MRITRIISFSNVEYIIETNEDKLIVFGDVWSYSFHFKRKSTGQIVATIGRDSWVYSNCYFTEISPTENVPLILACVIVIEHEEISRRDYYYY